MNEEVKKFHEEWVLKMLEKKPRKAYYIKKNNSKCFDCGIGIIQVRNGKLRYCLTCKKEHKRKRDSIRKHSTEYKIRSKEYYRKYPQKANHFSKYKDGAKYRGIEFNLTKEEFQYFWQKPCNYCGSEILTIGIDRVNNDIGYIKENSVACCKNCNLMKRNMSVEDFINHCKKIIEFNNN